jgi:hypothetical protein
MYNMDITLFGFKFNLEILILIGIVYLIMVGHTLCGCCNMRRIMEGMEQMDSSNVTKKINEKMNDPKMNGTKMNGTKM